MSNENTSRPRRAAMVVAVLAAAAVGVWAWTRPPAAPTQPPAETARAKYKHRRPIDSSGFQLAIAGVPPWPQDASLDRLAAAWRGIGKKLGAAAENRARSGMMLRDELVMTHIQRASFLNFDGEPDKAYAVLAELRQTVEADPVTAEDWLYTVVVYQGVTALRRGETDNCVMCRGETSCILPIAPAAVHTKPEGSRLAVKHFTEYLAEFPDDHDVRWLLNVAHLTLGEHPEKVDPRFVVHLEKYTNAEHSFGKFRDVGHLVGINRFNQAGGAILEDFDGDDRLDIVFTSQDLAAPMVFYRNKGDGTFEDVTEKAGLGGQLGGLNCVQADYNNDGRADIFIPRGGWFRHPMRPSLLKNNGNGTFTDVTAEAGLLHPVNSIAAQWADYDNDGHLDLFVCNETGPSRLYRNKGNGTFEEVSRAAGIDTSAQHTKGVAWIDYDGDRFPDLFVNSLSHAGRLFRNNGNGTFAEVSKAAGIDGPRAGFSCWAFDYDNDGKPDLFATCYDSSLKDIVNGMTGRPHTRQSNRLYRNLGNGRFQDATKEAGCDLVFSTMGSNFADFDNDGFLDFYLGTGNPDLSMLAPNRLMRNLGGARFADVTGPSGTGHLQKGHGVACGDWTRTGLVDIVIEMGGAVDGDRYHNVLFKNPGNDNNWLNLKLVGKETNRSAIGARIKVTTAGPTPRTIYRWVSSGSSFGANPLEQHVGLGKAEKVAELEVFWPTSNTTQVFKDVAVNQGVEVTEGAKEFRKREYKPIRIP